jgi:hypothetical protein
MPLLARVFGLRRTGKHKEFTKPSKQEKERDGQVQWIKAGNKAKTSETLSRLSEGT